METYGLKKSINNIPENEINNLINLFNEAIQFDRNLHGMIIKYATNKRLEKFHTMLSNQIHVFSILDAKKPERAKESLEHHKKILDAIKKNENLAIELLKTHINKVKNNIILDFVGEQK